MRLIKVNHCRECIFRKTTIGIHVDVRICHIMKRDLTEFIENKEAKDFPDWCPLEVYKDEH